MSFAERKCSEEKMQWNEKAPDHLIAQAIGGKLNRDTHPGT